MLLSDRFIHDTGNGYPKRYIICLIHRGKDRRLRFHPPRPLFKKPQREPFVAVEAPHSGQLPEGSPKNSFFFAFRNIPADGFCIPSVDRLRRQAKPAVPVRTPSLHMEYFPAFRPPPYFPTKKSNGGIRFDEKCRSAA